MFHFSDDPAISCFDPRPVRVAAARRAGQEWLNGPLVWAIDDDHQPLYLFPRDCPRILIWPKADTTPADRAAWWDARDFRMVAYVEEAWRERLVAAAICRYELPPASFRDLHDAGAWVSPTAVHPLHMDRLTDLPAHLARHDVHLRFVDTLVPLRAVWESSMHASGIRLRNAQGWGAPNGQNDAL